MIISLNALEISDDSSQEDLTHSYITNHVAGYTHLDQEISDVFEALHAHQRNTHISDLEYAAIAGVSSASSAVTASRILQSPHTKNPASLISLLGPDAARMGLTAGMAMGGFLIVSKIWKTFRQGLEAPFERENAEFKAALLKHQREFEEHMDAHVTQQLNQAEQALKELLREWISTIEEIHADVISQLDQQVKGYQDLSERIVDPAVRGELDRLFEQSAESSMRLSGIQKASQDTLKKYKKKKKNPVKRFLQGIFGKGKREETLKKLN